MAATRQQPMHLTVSCEHYFSNFDVLVTMHLSIILVINQLNEESLVL